MTANSEKTRSHEAELGENANIQFERRVPTLGSYSIAILSPPAKDVTALVGPGSDNYFLCTGGDFLARPSPLVYGGSPEKFQVPALPGAVQNRVGERFKTGLEYVLASHKYQYSPNIPGISGIFFPTRVPIFQKNFRNNTPRPIRNVSQVFNKVAH